MSILQSLSLHLGPSVLYVDETQHWVLKYAERLHPAEVFRPTALCSALNLLEPLDPQLANGERREAVLAPDALSTPRALLLLDLDADGLELRPCDDSAALEEPLVNVRAALEGEVAAADDGGAVEAEDVAGDDARHAEGEADGVAGLHEVGAAVDVEGDVVRGLGGEKREELADRVGDGGGLGGGSLLGVEGEGVGLGGLLGYCRGGLGGDGILCRLDDGRCGVEGAGADREEEGWREAGEGCPELQGGAQKCPAHDCGWCVWAKWTGCASNCFEMPSVHATVMRS